MPEPEPTPTAPTRPGHAGAWSRGWRAAWIIALLSSAWFASGISSEPDFVDEWAYVTQSYFADLLIAGRVDDPAWLEYPGFDLPPLPKYVIGASLRVQGLGRPGRDASRRWYRNTSTRSGPRGLLVAARWPSAIFGGLGCAAIFALGARAFGPRVGWAAAALLAIDPLYALHARRAMSDVPCEALILATAATALGLWQGLLSGSIGPRGSTARTIGTGVLGGLATLAKLNGVLGLLAVAAWAALALILPRVPVGGRLRFAAAAAVAGAVGFATFAALNPFLYAHPKETLPPDLARIAAHDFWGRVGDVADHRVSVSAVALGQFPAYALRTPADKLAVALVQGFGRFGPLGPRHSDSTIRFDAAQDRGGWAWAPVVLLGAIAAWARGLAQSRVGEPPVAWAVAVQAALAAAIVSAFIPLAWDRYLMSIQPGSALLGAAGLVRAWDVIRAIPGRSPTEGGPR